MSIARNSKKKKKKLGMCRRTYSGQASKTLEMKYFKGQLAFH